MSPASLESAAPVASLAAAGVVAAMALAGAWLARGTTAVPAAWWAVAAAAAFALESADRVCGGLAEPGRAASARLVVVALAACPIVSLLGAKRPQHGVWQFIVAALAAVLAMPAATAVFVRPGAPPDVHLLQRWFMAGLAVVSVANFIGTRQAAAAAAVVAGQVLLGRFFLPAAETARPSGAIDALGAGLVACGAAAAAVPAMARTVFRGGRVRAARPDADPEDPVAVVGGGFLALREMLGAAWALRIAERFNAEAESHGWPCRLRFDGLHVGGDPEDRSWRADAARAGRSILRRFVSADWLRSHERGSENRCRKPVPMVFPPPRR